MADLCHLHPLECLNNGRCTVNMLSNTTYCQCDSCYVGVLCESGYKQINRHYVFYIISIIELCLSLLNNVLSLELFLRCRRIRLTNRGIYLIVYSILSLLSNMLQVAYEAKGYYPNPLKNNIPQDRTFNCYVDLIGYNMLVYLCIWFSSFITLERGLIIYFGYNMNARRRRSFVTTIIMFVIAGSTVAPMLVYRCEWRELPNLQTARAIISPFSISTGILIYLVASLFVLVSFARHIRQYGTDNGSSIKTFFKLLYNHLFIFVPPISYIVGFIPYAIVYNAANTNDPYFPCGISTGVYIIKVLVEIIPEIPFVLTWLLFVYPSKVHMNEFYTCTWSGRQLFKILILFRRHEKSDKVSLSQQSDGS